MQGQFVYDQSMDAHYPDEPASRIASAIGEPARARMLYCLMDNRARTSTELAVVGEVSPSTASVHLNRLKAEGLVRVHIQGKHRYYALNSGEVAVVLEGLSVLAGRGRGEFVPSTPPRLRAARTCYDHVAGTLGVLLHDRFMKLAWMVEDGAEGRDSYEVTAKGIKALKALGLDPE